MQQFAKIPAKIITHDKAQVKALAVYFALKQLNWRGRIYQVKKNLKQLAQEFKISPNNLRSKIKYLVRNDFARYDGETLVLCSYSDLWANLEIENKRFIKYTGTNVKEIEYFIYYACIRDNIKKQEYTIKTKILIYELEQLDAQYKLGLLSPEFIAAMFKRARQRDRYYKDQDTGKLILTDYGRKLQKFARYTVKNNTQALKAHIDTYLHLMANSFELPSINPFTTLSYKGAAKTALNKTAPSTGYYFLDKLNKLGLIEIWNNSTRCNKKLNQAANMGKVCGWYQPDQVNSVVGKKRILSNMIFLTVP